MGRWVILVLGVATLALACGDSEGSSASQAGGTPASSGSSNPSGGFRTTPSGGTTSSTGGRTASGGSLTSFGGLENTNTGGKSASGGRNPASGGSAETSGGTSEATGGGGPAGAGGAQNPLECPELPGPSPDPDDGGAFPGPLSIVLGNEAQLGTYSTIEGNLTIGPSAPPTGARIETIDLTHLRVVEGDLMIRYTAMAEIELPRLERVTGQLWVTHNQQLTELLLHGHDALLLPSLAVPAVRLGAAIVKIGTVEEPVRNITLRLTQLFNITGHPAIASAEPGARWLYCYTDGAFAKY